MPLRRKGVTLIATLGMLLAAVLVRPAHSITVPKFAAEERYASLVVDANSGRVLSATNADHTLHPASLTKIMTIYMTFDALKRDAIELKQLLPVSAHAASMTPTELGLRAGDKISTEQAILGLVTKSANDAAVVLAEAIGGSEAEFAKKMTERALDLGMNQTNFANASGLPNPLQVSSARDMALLALAMLRDHPNEYRYFSTLSFTYRGRLYHNHNRLLALYKGADGIKTGFVNASGYNLVASAQRDGQRLIGVVFGGSSGRTRDAHMVNLLDDGFRSLRPNAPKPADDDDEAPLQLEASRALALMAATDDAFDFSPFNPVARAFAASRAAPAVSTVVAASRPAPQRQRPVKAASRRVPASAAHVTRVAFRSTTQKVKAS
jgi:D-alanyl-D-alanine carboxypeptidase